MRSAHIRTDFAYGEIYPNVYSDFSWIKANEKKLLQEHGECVILVYEKKVVGKGSTPESALQNAEASLPVGFNGVITPVIHFLAKRHPFLRIAPVEN